jgi:pyruvate-ferredoxin/flavodoxin oxidoreductase
MVIANATGCSSIYGGNLPTTPYTKNKENRGPTWNNSLFEDNAEFGLGFRLSIDKQKEYACELVRKFESVIGTALVEEIINAKQHDEAEIFQQRERVEQLKKKLQGQTSPEAKQLLSICDMLVKKSVWIFGGDGWAYDIGFGGLDHVISTGRNVNILVLDTEVYSNTGGQMSKATPRSAVAKFAAGGKCTAKKDLARIAMTYGNVYVASVAMGAKDEQTLKAFLEAEAYDGPSLIIAYSHCIAHGIDMITGLQHQKTAVQTGYWPLFRYNPDLIKQGQNPLQLDYAGPKEPLKAFTGLENRFKMLAKSNPEVAEALGKLAQDDVNEHWQILQKMAEKPLSS